MTTCWMTRGLLANDGAESCDFDVLTGDLGSKWWIRDTAFKAHPAGTWMRYPMLAIDRMCARGLQGDEILKIVVRTFLISAGGRSSSISLAAITTPRSLPLLLAHAGGCGSPDRWHRREVYEDPAVLEMIQKIELVPIKARADSILEQMKQWHGRTTKCPTTVEIHARGMSTRSSPNMPRVILTRITISATWSLVTSSVCLRRRYRVGPASTGDPAPPRHLHSRRCCRRCACLDWKRQKRLRSD